MAIKRNISYHISEDRLDRACYIMSTVGIGEVVRSIHGVDEKGRGYWRSVTDTGVIMIFNEQKDRVVTLWIAEFSQVSSIYKGNTPSWLIKQVKKNRQYIAMQNKVKM